VQTIDAQLVHQKKVRSFSDSNGFVNFFNITGQVAEIDYSNNRIRLLVSRRNPNYFLDIEMENSRIPARGTKPSNSLRSRGTSGCSGRRQRLGREVCGKIHQPRQLGGPG
jgi:hypothetical protein